MKFIRAVLLHFLDDHLPWGNSIRADILGPVAEIGHGLMEGYLHGEPPLNSAEFVPPPTENSARRLAVPQRAWHYASWRLRAQDLAAKMRTCISLLPPLARAHTHTHTSLPRKKSPSAETVSSRRGGGGGGGGGAAAAAGVVSSQLAPDR